MSPFVFRLDRFLKLRQHAERERAEALGAAVQAEEESKRNAESTAERVRAVADGITTEKGGISAAGVLHTLGMMLEAAAASRKRQGPTPRQAEGNRRGAGALGQGASRAEND